MEISEYSGATGRTYTLTGRFDAHQVPGFKARLEPLEGDVTLDFSGVSFVDSTGLATLVGLYKRARADDSALRIINVQDQVRVIFEITQLELLLDPQAAG